MERTVMSSSWPKSFAAWAIDAAPKLMIQSVRSNTNNSPDAFRGERGSMGKSCAAHLLCGNAAVAIMFLYDSDSEDTGLAIRSLQFETGHRETQNRGTE